MLNHDNGRVIDHGGSDWSALSARCADLSQTQTQTPGLPPHLRESLNERPSSSVPVRFFASTSLSAPAPLKQPRSA
jgi:hypothetical protein